LLSEVKHKLAKNLKINPDSASELFLKDRCPENSEIMTSRCEKRDLEFFHSLCTSSIDFDKIQVLSWAAMSGEHCCLCVCVCVSHFRCDAAYEVFR